jgi:hypothetical protein
MIGIFVRCRMYGRGRSGWRRLGGGRSGKRTVVGQCEVQEIDDSDGVRSENGRDRHLCPDRPVDRRSSSKATYR